MGKAATKACPFCAETIKAAALLCRFCGRDLPLPLAPAPLAPPIPPAAPEAPSAAATLQEAEVLDLLTSLIQKSLVVYEEDEQGQGRYRLLETVRQYARDRLLESGEGETVRERHRDWFLELAAVAVAQGRYEEAHQIAAQESEEVQIEALGDAGHAARERGDYEWAATFYRRSLSLRQKLGDGRKIVQSLEDYAGLAARQQQWNRAARLLGAAEGVAVEIGATLPLAVPEEYERAVREARAALGEEAFAVAWAAGRALPLEDAIHYAQETEPS